MPAQKPIRRAQLITPFGVGAMVDFPRDESLMVAGLDAWPFAKESCPPDWLVLEERLQARLGVQAFRYWKNGCKPGLEYRHFGYHRNTAIRRPACGSRTSISLACAFHAGTIVTVADRK